MNINALKISAVLLLLVVESHGGVIDGVYERIKNTTTGLRQDVKNAWSYGKGLVGANAGEHKEEERGLIGGMIHSAHEKVHHLHEQLWEVEEIPNDHGLLWNMYCRLKQRLAKAKHFILGDGNQLEGTTQAPSAEAILIKDSLEKLFNEDGTRKIVGEAFDQAIEDLKKKVNEMRKNVESSTPVNDGEGIIDIRMGDGHGNLKEQFAEAAAVDTSDKVKDDIDAANDKVIRNANSGVESIQNGLDKVQDEVIGLKDKAIDAEAKER